MDTERSLNLYDSDGTRVGFTYNGTAYYYTKNAQGDVTGIVDSNANAVVEYSYDAWGKLLSTTGSLAGTIGKMNPFLYRGYYYDAETRLYYLNSRYYDPNTGRFISEDGQFNPDTGLTGNNLFAYCNNNPITMVDYDGKRMLAEPGIETPQVQVMAAKYTNESREQAYKQASLPPEGEANSKQELYDEDGNLKQERWYGPDGKAVLDKDYSHGGVGHTFPHYHDWDWSKEKPRQDGYTKIVGSAMLLVGSIAVIGLATDDATIMGIFDDFLVSPVLAFIAKGAELAY